jgi:hypothetical protein
MLSIEEKRFAMKNIYGVFSLPPLCGCRRNSDRVFRQSMENGGTLVLVTGMV